MRRAALASTFFSINIAFCRVVSRNDLFDAFDILPERSFAADDDVKERFPNILLTGILVSEEKNRSERQMRFFQRVDRLVT